MTVILVKKRFVGDATFDKLKLWVIPVTIKGEERKRDFNLLLDTGAQRTVIIPKVKENLDLLEVNQESVQGVGVTGNSQYSTVIVNLEIGSINLLDVNILVGSLPGVFSRYQIVGILGADVLQFLSLKIDYLDKLLEIERPTVYF
jgi:predicted aspartyl protease